MKNLLLHLGVVITLHQTMFAMETWLDIAQKEVQIMEKIIAPDFEQYLHGKQPAITHNPYKNTIAYATHHNGISDGEKTFLQKRLPVVKAALENLLNCQLNDNQVPKIAFVGSGGGYRAMLCTLGSLCGARKKGILDTATYITALSGSTWAVGPFISTKLPLKKFKEYIQDCIAQPLHETTQEEQLLIANAIAVKKIYNQTKTLVDIYGDLLGNRLLACLDDKRHMTYLSEQAEIIASGAYPYPIYTAIDGRADSRPEQTWYVYTPHTIGDHTTNIHIPTWAYGRKFKKGQSRDYAPEKSLGYIMGTCGSAFAADLNTMLDKVIKNEEIQQYAELFLELKGKRLPQSWSEIPNYMRKMNIEDDTELSKADHLKLIDAGLSKMNLPYPPVSGICPERKADILIFLDASGGTVGKQLTRVTDYAKKHKLPFPTINLENIGTKTISIFKDEHNPLAPVVIYMPRISDPALWETHKNDSEFANYNLSGFNLDLETEKGFCTTDHFQYTQEQSSLVLNQTEFNMRVNKDEITEAIRWWVDKR